MKWSVDNDQIQTYTSDWEEPRYGLLRRKSSWWNNGWTKWLTTDWLYLCYTLAYSNWECSQLYDSVSTDYVIDGINLWVR